MPFALLSRMTYTLRTPGPLPILGLLAILLACAFPASARAQEENRLRRVAIHPHQGYTRVNLFFQDPPDYTVRLLPGRVRLEVRGADAPSFKKLRSYADPQLSGVIVAEKGGVLSVSIPVRDPRAGVQAISCGNPEVLSLDIGPGVNRATRVDIAPGREPILSGTEQFVREFDAEPAGVPFVPTDGKVLKEMLPEAEALLFQQGESLLYRDQAEEALAVFSTFTNKAAAPRALAHYRIGEALGHLGRHQEALAAFRQGEALWPQYLDQAPELLQSYSDALAKTGDFGAARALLLRLMNKFVGTPYQAELLTRLADLIERHGLKSPALAMYRSVAVYAPGSSAASRARLKLADRELFTLSRDRYRELLQKYRTIYEEPGDFALRDEALFKMALLLALYAPPREALDTLVSYDKRYPRGIFSTIVKRMREELLLPVYQELAAAGKDQALVELAIDNKEYLARCFSDTGFAPGLSRAFERTGMLTREMELFHYLDEKNWAASDAPFMLSRVVDDAVALGNAALAESTGREFLGRYPRDPRAGRVREQLGRVAFEKGDLAKARTELSFLNGKGQKPQFPDSDYYLGKALASAGDRRGAVRSLARFADGVKEDHPLLPDGYFTLAVALAAVKDYPRALAACQVGGSLATGEMAGQFLYKTGELQLQLGEVSQARASWEKASGLGGTWGKLASEALGDLAWRMKISSQLP